MIPYGLAQIGQLLNSGPQYAQPQQPLAGQSPPSQAGSFLSNVPTAQSMMGNGGGMFGGLSAGMENHVLNNLGKPYSPAVPGAPAQPAVAPMAPLPDGTQGPILPNGQPASAAIPAQAQIGSPNLFSQIGSMFGEGS